jgi:hypothetical protein
MKRLFLICAAAMMVGGMALAQANQTADVNVTAVVNGLFRLTLNTAAINYALDPGQTDNTQSVVANVRTNHNVAWYLKLHKDQDLTMGTETIPSANFTYAGSGGLGPWVSGQFPAAAAVGYTADASEYKVTGPGLNLTTTYSLTIPDDQTAGTYTNTITYTLTVTP